MLFLYNWQWMTFHPKHCYYYYYYYLAQINPRQIYFCIKTHWLSYLRSQWLVVAEEFAESLQGIVFGNAGCHNAFKCQESRSGVSSGRLLLGCRLGGGNGWHRWSCGVSFPFPALARASGFCSWCPLRSWKSHLSWLHTARQITGQQVANMHSHRLGVIGARRPGHKIAALLPDIPTGWHLQLTVRVGRTTVWLALVFILLIKDLIPVNCTGSSQITHLLMA